jgi:peptidoglycan/LPS O-acetylase OafA/YrhL
MYYNKYLDTYRFIAVILVILFHWFPTYFSFFPFAKLGVDMFFLLSGYLITNILLREKESVDSGKLNLLNAFKVFYIRRGLRIFPIYYLLIFVLLFLGYPLIKSNFSYFLLYGVNFLVLKEEKWLEMVSHLWTLSVEEQFYLLWPAIILLAPKRFLNFILALIIMASLIFIFINEYFMNTFYYVHLLGCAATLGSGGVTAIFTNKNHEVHWKINSFLLFIASIFFYYLSRLSFYNNLWLTLSFIFFSCSFIFLLVNHKSRTMNFIFGNPILCWFGKVSYGLYLYHNIVPWILRNLNGTENYYSFTDFRIFPIPKNGIEFLLFHTFILLFLTMFSYFVIEKPFNSLKKKYDY